MEEYLGALVRGLPGLEGMSLRYLVLKSTAARVGGFCYVYRGATLTHTYGLRVGRDFHVNTGAHIDARGGITAVAGNRPEDCGAPLENNRDH